MNFRALVKTVLVFLAIPVGLHLLGFLVHVFFDGPGEIPHIAVGLVVFLWGSFIGLALFMLASPVYNHFDRKDGE